VCLSA